MEYIQGQTLDKFIQGANRKEIKLTEPMLKKLVLNLVSAVDFVHKANVIHRDIKPANIIVNDVLDVKLIDFGLSRTHPDSHFEN